MLAPRMTRVTVLLVGAVLLSLACSVTPHFVDDKPDGGGGAGAAADSGIDVDTTCDTANDCSGVDGVCLTRRCEENKCRPAFTGRGIALPTQQMGDCHAAVCDGYGHEILQVDVLDRPANGDVAGDCKKPGCTTAGEITEVVDNTDLPMDDGNPCTTSTCSNGVASHSTRPNNDSCGDCMWCQGGTCMACTCVNNLCVPGP
jgi:hypothetical protein